MKLCRLTPEDVKAGPAQMIRRLREAGFQFSPDRSSAVTITLSSREPLPVLLKGPWSHVVHPDGGATFRQAAP